MRWEVYVLQRGIAWIAIYLAVLVAPLVVIFAGETPAGRSFLLEFSIALGFLGLTLIVLQFLVSARIRPLTKPFGIDVVLRFHRQVGLLALVLVLAHPLLLAWERETLSLFDPVDGTWAARFGLLAIVLLLALTGTSIWRVQLRLSYERWHLTHTLLAVAVVVLSFGHVVQAGAYLETTWKEALWLRWA